MGTWGGKAVELSGRVRPPLPPSFPKHGPKNRGNQVSKRKRNEKVECHDLRHALRLLFSPRGSPSLGLPPGVSGPEAAGARALGTAISHGLWSGGVLPFYSSLFSFLLPATGSFLA